MTALAHITDHAEQAKARLLSQFRDATALLDLVDILVGPVQSIEDVLQQWWAKSQLGNATGDQLDQWGELLDEPRAGMTDVEYRAVLRGKLSANRSVATPEHMIGMAVALTGADVVHAHEFYPAAFRIDVGVVAPLSDAQRTRVSRLLETAKPAGVDLRLVEYLVSGPFGFEGNPEALGFGDGHFGGRIDE